MSSFLVCLISLLGFCAVGFATECGEQDGVDIGGLSRSVDEFTLKLYKQAVQSKPNENIFISPAIVSVALAMLKEGARGVGAEEIKNIVLSGLPTEQVRNTLLCYLEHLNQRDRKFQLKAANGIFLDESFTPKQDFMDTLRNYYRAKAEKKSFERDPEEARRSINSWVADQTNDRIPELLPEGFVDSDTVMVLASAIYFKGSWDLAFDPSKTMEMDFKSLPHATNDIAGRVQMMRITTDRKDFYTPYTSDDDLKVQVVALPYKNAELSMYVLLPNPDSDLLQLESQLTSGTHLRRLLDGVHSAKFYALGLPKFKMDFELKLKEALKNLGVDTMFSDQADMSGIADQPLKVSDVIHKAFVQVNEEGTEAAAAVGSGMRLLSLGRTVVADRPFLFLIQHNPTKTILFMGRHVFPTQMEE